VDRNSVYFLSHLITSILSQDLADIYPIQFIISLIETIEAWDM